jgi:NSS family neurotransmitter:Na+ symporter
MAIFATLTSCISVLEAIVANIMAIFHADRKKVTLIMGAVYLIATAVIALGYSIFYVEVKLPNGSTGQLLDIMDYISNSFMMPFISMISTILIGWIVGPKWIIDDLQSTGDKFRRKYVYIVMIKYVAPIMMFILFLQSTGILGMFIK